MNACTQFVVVAKTSCLRGELRALQETSLCQNNVEKDKPHPNL